MSNSYYNHSTYPSPNAPGSSAALRSELNLIMAGFDLLPTLAGNGYKVAMVNAAGTAIVATSALQSLAITGSTIDSTPIGATTASSGAFTTLSATSATVGGVTVVTTTGTQTLTNKSISGSSNTLTNIANGSLTNSSLTIGSTAISLGATATTLGGLTSVTSTSFVGALTGNASNVTGTVAIANGGTGATTAAAARANVLPSFSTNANKVLVVNAGETDAVWTLLAGTGTVTSVAVSGGTTGLTTTGGPITSAGTITLSGTLAVANGGTGSTTSTGSGSVVLATSPTLVTPALGTPASATLTNATGLPLSTGVTGTLPVGNGGTGITAGTSGGIPYFSAASTVASSAALAASALVVGGGAGVAPSTVTTGTGVLTALSVNTGTAGAFVVNGGALGTPSSGTVTNLTGTASININGTVGATTASTGNFTSVTSTSEVVTGAAGILTRAAATQDGVELIGRAGGTTSLKVTFTPTTLTASRTLTLPDNSGTVLTTGAAVTVAQGGTGATTLTGILKGNGTSAFTAATANTDYVTSTGADGSFTRWMLQDAGYVYFNSNTTNALDYVNGSHQRWAPNTGAQTLSITNWPPTGNLGELLIEGVNLGAATITWPTINWIKSDGTTTTTFSSNGVTLQTSGTDWVLLWTRDAGTTIYGKIVR